MLRFIHTFTPESAPALLKAGLWREGDGVKLMHKPSFAPPHDFNSVFAGDTPFTRFIGETGCPFYIDRLQGGIGNTRVYPYDRTILEGLERRFGDKFLGFQMHEWASNLKSDLDRISALAAQEDEDPAKPSEAFWQKVKSGRTELFLEAFAPAEWQRIPLPDTPAAYLKLAHALYRRRVSETNGRLIPADSYFMAPRFETENGAHLLLPEAGWQIPNLRAQAAYTSGMARAAGVPWGIYYECWHNTKDAGFTIPFSLRTGQDEWLEDLLHKGNGAALPPETREHGGSALNLLERAWIYTWFKGASLLAEEYGVCNTFRSLQSAELSPYGERKKAFLDLIGRLPPPGTPFAPAAAVLPADMPMLDVNFSETYLGFSNPEGLLSETALQALNRGAEEIFGKAGARGNMGHVLKTGGLPDAVELIHEDTPTLGGYRYLINLTGDEGFSRRHKNAVSPAEAEALLTGLLPCRTDRRLHFCCNRTPFGWHVLLMNNDGITHDAFSPDKTDPAAGIDAPITLRDPAMRAEKAAGSGSLFSADSGLRVRLGGGEWLLIKITEP